VDLGNGGMKREDFEAWLGEEFQASLPTGERVVVVLKEAGALTPPPESVPDFVRKDPFFLVFHGPQEPVLDGAIVPLSGPDGREFALSLNSEAYVDHDKEKGIKYYVVVN
jgi:hypothetical protein